MSLGPAWEAAGKVEDAGQVAAAGLAETELAETELAGADEPEEVDQVALAAAYAVLAPPRTGDAEVDHAMAELAAWAVAQGTLQEQLAGYEAAHRILQARLADVEG